jgi:hypothetical protein
VSGPTSWLTITDIRTYDNGLLVKVTQTVNSACGFPDHLQVYTNNPNYQASFALFMAAWAQGKRIAAYYDGCGPNGAVNVFGWYVEP